MPITSSAKKALRKDRRRTMFNKRVKTNMKEALKAATGNPNPETVSGAFQAVDRAVKKNQLHKNKAARLKSRLSKLIKPGTSATKTAKKASPKKTTSKKAAK